MDFVTVDIFDFIYFGGKGKGKARAFSFEPSGLLLNIPD